MTVGEESSTQRRLLFVSSRVRNKPAIYAAALPLVTVLEYNYDSTTLDDLLAQAKRSLGGKAGSSLPQKVSSAALILHSSERELFICAPGEAKLSRKTLVNDEKIRNFFARVVDDFIDLGDWSARLDFLATYMAEQLDGGLLSKELEQMLGCQVGLSKSLEGGDIQVMRSKATGRFITVGEMYFDMPTLKNQLAMVGKATKDGQKKLLGYEKLRVVGKGAFGSAVLYRRKTDGVMCIIKEINLLELSASDRLLALNEVSVLAKLDHPNITAYHDSFERDGVLMIEMEYADGGNLQDFLKNRKVVVEERELLEIFTQMISAIRYVHSRNVLHRDLKTANIFLTKEGMVKVGDFGISKVLTTRQAGAVTVLGTPYYISPEMCEGKVYDEKSDIWALGCIAYEMACLQKTFEGSNLPALVNKIMRGQFTPIRGDYSPLFKQLVRDLLQKDPEFRPTASEILLVKLPEIQAYLDNRFDPEGFSEDELLDVKGKTRQSRPPRSVLYYLKGYEATISLTPVQLPPRSRILQVSVSNTHCVALSSELMVFTWGEGRRGQLGHGEVESWRSKPFCVETLKAKSITHVGAGDGFSVFTSDNGIVMTCGDGSFGALGHGDWHSSAHPKMVEKLLGEDVSAVACGPEHVVVVSGQGDVFAWGRGEGGRLGLGHEEDCCTPKEVKIDSEKVYIVNAKCSGDATILLTSTGQLYACGGNRYNRLGLDEAKVSFLTTHIEKVLVPTRVKTVKDPIVNLAMGPNHTVCLTSSCKIISFGRNSEGQLGLGHAKSVSGPSMVKSMQAKETLVVSCGATFTVVGTNENVIYFWGTRFISPSSRPNTRDAFNQSFGARLATAASEPMTDVEVRKMVDRERPSQRYNNLEVERTMAALSSSELLDRQGEILMKDIVTEPQEILALYASPQQQEKGETVMLGNIQSQNQNIFLVVETTCPLSRSNRPATAASNHPDAPAVMDITDEDDDEELGERVEDEMNGSASMPDWLMQEIEDAENIHRPSTSKERKANSAASKHKGNNHAYQKKLETKFNKRQMEIRMEAQNAVREREKVLNDEVHRLREELEKQRAKDQEMQAKSKEGSCILQ